MVVNKDAGMNEYSRNATYQLCQVPMLVQTINPVHLSLTLTHSLQQYSQIIDEMTNQRVFTENAIDVLSQMLKNAKCDLAKNYVSAINIMLTIGNNIYDCGNTYIGRLKEKKALLSQSSGNYADIISTIDSVHSTLVDLLSQARNLDRSLDELRQVLLQPSIPISPQVQQLSHGTDISLPVGVMPLQSITGYQPNLSTQPCYQIVSPVLSVNSNRLVPSQPFLVSRTVVPSTTENIVSCHNEASSYRVAKVPLNQSQFTPPSKLSIRPSNQPPMQPAIPSSSQTPMQPPPSPSSIRATPEQTAVPAKASVISNADSTKTVRGEPIVVNPSRHRTRLCQHLQVACLQSHLQKSKLPCLLPATLGRNKRPLKQQESGKSHLRKWNHLRSPNPHPHRRVPRKDCIVF